MEKDDKSLGDILNEISSEFEKAMDAARIEQDEYWESLTHDQQLMAFCSVARRIHQGEIKEKGSYRYVLYDVFGFGYEAYVLAQEAGYLEIHNAIVDSNFKEELLKEFCDASGIEDADTKIKQFMERV